MQREIIDYVCMDGQNYIFTYLIKFRFLNIIYLIKKTTDSPEGKRTLCSCT